MSLDLALVWDVRIVQFCECAHRIDHRCAELVVVHRCAELVVVHRINNAALSGGTLLYHRSPCPDIIWGAHPPPKKNNWGTA